MWPNACRPPALRKISSTREHDTLLACASPDEVLRVRCAGAVFYGGKTYSDAEFKAASEAGSLPQASLAGGVATSSFPTFTEVLGFSGAPEIINGRLAVSAGERQRRACRRNGAANARVQAFLHSLRRAVRVRGGTQMLGFVAALGAELSSGA